MCKIIFSLSLCSPCGKKFRSKPQIARFLGDCADLSCFDFSRAGTPGDGTQRRRARDRTAKKNAIDLMRPMPPVRPLSVNPLRPSGPIRRTCGVIKLPVTCVAPPTDDELKNNFVPTTANSDPVNPPSVPSTSVSTSSSNIVVPSLWESRLCGVKAYNHETGSEISMELNKPQNGLNTSSTLPAGVNTRQFSTANLQNLPQQQNTQQLPLGVTPGTHNLIEGLNSTPSVSSPLYNSPTLVPNPQVTQQHKAVMVSQSTSPVPSILQHVVGGGSVGISLSLRENGQQYSSGQSNNTISDRQQSHLSGKEFRQGAVTQSTNVTSAVPAFRVSPIVVNGPAKTTSVNAETMTHFVSETELRIQEEKVRLLRQKLMAAQNSV